MAMRLRVVEDRLVALCAAETEPMPNDVYLDDGQHYAIAEKFWRDYQGETITWQDEESNRLAETQKRKEV